MLGITGNPGSGKSTLTNALIRELGKATAKVGVLAAAPSSPFTGGAILGDRVRMQEHTGNPNVFIRSLAASGEGDRRRRRSLEQMVLRHVHPRLLAEVEERLARDGHFAGAVDGLLARTADPFTLSEAILAHVRRA